MRGKEALSVNGKLAEKLAFGKDGMLVFSLTDPLLGIEDRRKKNIISKELYPGDEAFKGVGRPIMAL